MHINLEEVQEWSQNNLNLYKEIKENGFADFICNKPHIRENYKELFFENSEIEEIDPETTEFTNLETLHLNFNRIKRIDNLPKSLKELYIF